MLQIGVKCGVDKTGVDKTGVDKSGVDETGVDKTVVNELGCYPSVYNLCPQQQKKQIDIT